MSIKRIYPIILAAAISVALSSCKKDEETQMAPSLNGTLSFHLPEFVTPDELISMKPQGLTHPDGKYIGYSWKVSPGMTKADTTRREDGLSPDGKESDGTFTYPFPDTLGTYTVNCYGFASGYSTSYASAYTNVVKGGLDESITGTGILQNDSKIRVDGTEYFYTQHNDLDWFRNNLANPSYGVPYSGTEAMREVFGNYYSYEDAVKACPEGWRLPTDAEWVELGNSLKPESGSETGEAIKGIAADLMADISFNGKQMWEYWPAVGDITNRSLLAAIPAGYANLGEKSKNGGFPMATFFGIYEYAAFWTADKVEGNDSMAYYRYIFVDQPDMQIGKGDINTFGANVRCVRENE